MCLNGKTKYLKVIVDDSETTPGMAQKTKTTNLAMSFYSYSLFGIKYNFVLKDGFTVVQVCLKTIFRCTYEQ